ncbi:MAG: ATP synthase F1 subunit gamma [Deltaproteobacteria bacterium]|nr:ATP synthase F1 subunit gamma [Deltaproteobacteria bacterium]MBP7286118.1 ATP synthase F1 subunit gamma [Nannocystaceae bacterium]
MANLKELRNRIGSVKNTRKITAAMSQIASARLKKAQDAVTAAKPYGDRMREVIESLVSGIEASERGAAHPLLEQRKVERELLLVMTADRGLCGGFNTNIARATIAWIRQRRAEGVEVEVVAIGKKAAAALQAARIELRATHEAPTLATLVEVAKAVIADAIAAFTGKSGKRVDAVRLFFNEFVSVLTQKVHNDVIIPLQPGETVASGREPTYEPSREAVLQHLVALAIEARLQQAMFNSIAAEIAARRVAMDAATDNASEMIADLTLVYNRERQAAITKELMEIIGGAEALKG